MHLWRVTITDRPTGRERMARATVYLVYADLNSDARRLARAEHTRGLAEYEALIARCEVLPETGTVIPLRHNTHVPWPLRP